MNSVTLVGNIAGDIYSGKQNGRPLLRLLMNTGRPRLITGIRIVLLDGQANEFYSSLRKGSEIGILGHITNRWYQHNYVSEVEVRNLVLLRNYSWADIESRETMIEQGGGKAFIEGTIVSDVLFEWRQWKKGKFLGMNDQYAFLKFDLSSKAFPDSLTTIVTYGFLAELIYPYLRQTSEVARVGHFRQDRQSRWAVVAENVALLRNIDYIRAAAAQSRRMQMWEIDHIENGE
jgi:single-stranded DNA-binding protein